MYVLLRLDLLNIIRDECNKSKLIPQNNKLQLSQKHLIKIA